MYLNHSGSHGAIHNATGNMYFSTAGSIFFSTQLNESAITANANGAVELYHNGTKRFETSATGVNLYNHSYSIISGAMGSTENIKITNTTSGAYIQIGLQQQDSDGLHHRAYIKARKGSACLLYTSPSPRD